MTQFKNGFESGLTVGTTLTTANMAYPGNDAAGAIAGIPKQGGAGAHGAGSMDISAGVTAAQAAIDIAAIASKLAAARFYFYIETGGTPSTFNPIFSINNNGTADVIALLNISSARRLQLQSRGVTQYYPTTVYAEATWYRVEFELQILTATTGVLSFRTYEGDSTVVKDSWTSSTLDLGTTDVGRARFGKVNAAGTQNIRIDDLVYDNAKSTPIGPYVAGQSVVRPVSVSENIGPWTAVGAASITAAVADSDDSSYAQTPDGPNGSSLTVLLDTLNAGDAGFEVRMSCNTGTATAKVQLLQGSTVIAERTFNISTTIAAYAFNLSSSENALITNRAALYLKTTVTV